MSVSYIAPPAAVRQAAPSAFGNQQVSEEDKTNFDKAYTAPTSTPASTATPATVSTTHAKGCCCCHCSGTDSQKDSSTAPTTAAIPQASWDAFNKGFEHLMFLDANRLNSNFQANMAQIHNDEKDSGGSKSH